MNVDIEAIKQRRAVATPGQWRVQDDKSSWKRVVSDQPFEDTFICRASALNAPLIAHAPTDLAALIDAVEAYADFADSVTKALFSWLALIGKTDLISTALGNLDYRLGTPKAEAQS